MEREISDRAILEESLRRDHERLANTLETMTDGFVSLDKDWRYIYINQRAAEMFGRKPEELIGKHIWTEFPEGIGQTFYHNYYKAVEEGKPITMEEYYPPWNRWFENRIYPTPDGLSIFFQEITERKRAEELVNGQNKLLEMIVTGRPLPETLTALILFIEKQAPELLCSVLLLDEDGIHMRHGSAPSLPAEYVSAIDGSAIGPKTGSCGTSAFRKEPVFVEDIENDPLWEDYKFLALPHNLRACWSSPIFDEQHKVLGTFAVYYRRPALPEPFHLRLIEMAAHVAAISITGERDRQIMQRAQERLKLIYDAVTDIIFLLDVDAEQHFKFASVNQAFLRATGLQSVQVIGKNVEDVIPLASQELVFGNYRKAIHAKEAIQWEEVSDYPSGRKTAIVKVNPVFNEQGICTNLVGAVQDITDFRNVEETLRKKQEELEHVFKTAPVGLALLDENLRFVRTNEEYAALNGISPENHVGKTIHEIFPDVTQDVEAIFRQVLESGQPVLNLETHGRVPSQPNRDRDWLASYYPVKSDDGRARGVGVVALEITDRAGTAALGQMALGNTDLDTLIQEALKIVSQTLNLPIAIVFELLPDGENLAIRSSIGWTVPEGLRAGKDTQAGFTLHLGEPVIVEDTSRETRFTVPSLVLEGGIVSTMTVLILGKKNPYGVLGVYSRIRHDFSPAEVHFLQTVAHILGTTIERRKLEEQIFQTQKMELIGRLAAGVAHQLNTPLAVIMMRLQMLQEDLAITAPESMSQLEILLSSARKMSTIIQDLLNFARIPGLHKERVQIETILKQILSFVEVRAKKQRVQVERYFTESIPPIAADKNRLEQALLNIIVNALDAMPDGGTLFVAAGTLTEDGKEFIRIEFQDSGSGMSADEISKIFDPFFTTKPVGKGTGLGLPVSYEIIRSHEGEIRVTSKKGTGSTFQILLPVK